MRVGYLTVGLGYLALYALVGWALEAHPFARTLFGNVGVAVPGIAVAVVVFRRRHEWSGCQRLFWQTIALGMVLWAVGHAGWVFDAMAGTPDLWLRWHTLFTLCGGIAPLVALLARPHAGVRPDAVTATGYDMVSYGLLGLFIYADFVMIPDVLPAANGEVLLFALIQVNRFLLLAGMIWFAIASRRTAWSATYWRIAGAVAAGSVARAVTSLAIVRGAYQSGTLYDFAWILPWIGYGWAAQTSPASPPAADRVELPSRATPPVLGAVPVLLVPLIGYTSMHSGGIGTLAESFRGLLTGVVTVAGLGLLTLRLASQSDELQRADWRLKLLAAATEQTRDLILIMRADGSFEHANEAFLRAMGYARADLAAMRFDRLVDGGFQDLGDHIARAVREHGVWRGTVLHRRRDGSTFSASCTVVALEDAGHHITHFVGVERDITEELLLRDQLVHTERLSAMGELIAGVAHEINNPLQTIIGAVELMLEETRADAPGGAPETAVSFQNDLELVRREAGRAGQIVRNLLSFIRRSAPNRATADLNDIVRTTVELRQYHLGQRNIATELQCDAEPLPVLANREEIQQVILNLLLNAEQAIASSWTDAISPRGGTITVRTSRAPGFTIVEVSDDGPGVKAEMRRRIFEPFFTTKEVGQGTGLGLSISHGIASAHGGSLELCPSAAGACFRLTLPVAPSAAVT